MDTALQYRYTLSLWHDRIFSIDLLERKCMRASKLNYETQLVSSKLVEEVQCVGYMILCFKTKSTDPS